MRRSVEESKKQALLKKAAAKLGTQALAEGLRVPVPLLEAWINGHASMPDRKFLALADLLDGLSDPPK